MWYTVYMKLLIVNNPYLSTAAYLNQSRRLRQELADLGVEADIIRNEGYPCRIAQDGAAVCALDGYDGCVYLDKDKYLSAMLEKSGLRLFNRHQAIVDCDDKMTTAIRLIGAGIPMPITLPGKLCFDASSCTVADSELDSIEQALGYPVVCKECYGSLGTGVYLANDREQLQAIADKLIGKPHLFQQFVATSRGRDIRAIVIGGKVIACMQRTSHTDWRANLGLGGTAQRVEADDEVVRIATTACRVLGLDYAGVDLLYGSNGYYLCEVNSNAFWGGIEPCTGVNVAAAYAQYIVQQLGGLS